MANLVLVVAAALIDAHGRILIAQRPVGKRMAGLWEFPGGKVEPGERPDAALIRELKEELEVGVSRDDLEPFAFASHAYADFHLLMPLWLVRRWSGEIVAVEHKALAWAHTDELANYPMPPADEVLVTRLMERPQ